MHFTFWWTKKKPRRRRHRHRSFRVRAVDYKTKDYRERERECEPEIPHRPAQYVQGASPSYLFEPLTYVPTAPRRESYLTSMPPEVQHNVFSHLDPFASTAAGLSSRKLYPVHRSRHRKVSLFETSPDYGLPMVFTLKRDLPQKMVLDWESERLVTRDRLRELDERRREKDREYYERKIRAYGGLREFRGYEDYDKEYYQRR